MKHNTTIASLSDGIIFLDDATVNILSNEVLIGIPKVSVEDLLEFICLLVDSNDETMKAYRIKAIDCEILISGYYHNDKRISSNSLTGGKLNLWLYTNKNITSKISLNYKDIKIVKRFLISLQKQF